mmetsp:Transcript_15258/g.50108  ORF Transcript_15258/g.50108 Transcript_15258/m.50108 type:complete len:710 (+) Transcript_15258:1400-3529(+)
MLESSRVLGPRGAHELVEKTSELAPHALPVLGGVVHEHRRRGAHEPKGGGVRLERVERVDGAVDGLADGLREVLVVGRAAECGGGVLDELVVVIHRLRRRSDVDSDGPNLLDRVDGGRPARRVVGESVGDAVQGGAELLPSPGVVVLVPRGLHLVQIRQDIERRVEQAPVLEPFAHGEKLLAAGGARLDEAPGKPADRRAHLVEPRHALEEVPQGFAEIVKVVRHLVLHARGVERLQAELAHRVHGGGELLRLGGELCADARVEAFDRGADAGVVLALPAILRVFEVALDVDAGDDNVGDFAIRRLGNVDGLLQALAHGVPLCPVRRVALDVPERAGERAESAAELGHATLDVGEAPRALQPRQGVVQAAVRVVEARGVDDILRDCLRHRLHVRVHGENLVRHLVHNAADGVARTVVILLPEAASRLHELRDDVHLADEPLVAFLDELDAVRELRRDVVPLARHLVRDALHRRRHLVQHAAELLQRGQELRSRGVILDRFHHVVEPFVRLVNVRSEGEVLLDNPADLRHLLREMRHCLPVPVHRPRNVAHDGSDRVPDAIKVSRLEARLDCLQAVVHIHALSHHLDHLTHARNALNRPHLELVQNGAELWPENSRIDLVQVCLSGLYQVYDALDKLLHILLHLVLHHLGRVTNLLHHVNHIRLDLVQNMPHLMKDVRNAVNEVPEKRRLGPSGEHGQHEDYQQQCRRPR